MRRSECLFCEDCPLSQGHSPSRPGPGAPAPVPASLPHLLAFAPEKRSLEEVDLQKQIESLQTTKSKHEMLVRRRAEVEAAIHGLEQRMHQELDSAAHDSQQGSRALKEVQHSRAMALDSLEELQLKLAAGQAELEANRNRVREIQGRIEAIRVSLEETQQAGALQQHEQQFLFANYECFC
jgi:hypothetical protein